MLLRGLDVAIKRVQPPLPLKKTSASIIWIKLRQCVTARLLKDFSCNLRCILGRNVAEDSF